MLFVKKYASLYKYRFKQIIQYSKALKLGLKGFNRKQMGKMDAFIATSHACPAEYAGEGVNGV
jgi:hypothetical protein